MVGKVSEVKRNGMSQRHYFRQCIFSLLSKKKMNKANISQSPWVLYDLPGTINLKFLGSRSVCIHALKSMKSYTQTLGVIAQGFKIIYSHLH